MKTHITLKNQHSRELPQQFRDDDVRYTEELVEIFLEEFTQPGDMVFDPFAGYGTSLLAAEGKGRQAWGVEFLPERAEYIRSILKYPERLIQGDSLKLNQYDLPSFDFSITSPPYMCRGDEENPFASYKSPGRGYEAYLEDIRQIYTHVKSLMKPEATVVIEVSNVKQNRQLTTLAWDIAKSVGQVLDFQGEVIVNWDHYGFQYDHSYCLIFK